MPLHAQWSALEDDPRPRNLGFLYQVFQKDDWNKSNFAAEKDTQWFRDAKYGMFVHFGLATYKNAELSWGGCQTRKAPDTGSGPYPEAEWTAWPNEMRLPDFDAKKMVEYAREAGHVSSFTYAEYMACANKPSHGGIYNYALGNW